MRGKRKSSARVGCADPPGTGESAVGRRKKRTVTAEDTTGALISEPRCLLIFPVSVILGDVSSG